MEFGKDVVTRSGVVVIFVAMALVGLLLSYQFVIFIPKEVSTILAAWVQAIGSILAIGAAVVLFERERQLVREGESQKQAEADAALRSMVTIVIAPFMSVVSESIDALAQFEKKFQIPGPNWAKRGQGTFPFEKRGDV